MQLRRLSIVGVGLLGGSIGLAIRKRISGCKIIGYGHRMSTLAKAQELGAIDEIAPTIQQAVEGADLTVLCTPVGLLAQNLRDIAGHISGIVTDVGSTKRSVVQAAREAGVRFVGSHPMAGSEKRGVEHARADLFEGALCILTPDSTTDPASLQMAEAFWKGLGMRVMRLSPDEHDRLICDASHLPHLVAAALVHAEPQAALAMAGKGFLDATRIAAGDPGLWRDIFIDNGDNLLHSIESFERALATARALVAAGKSAELEAWLASAASRRARMASPQE